MVLIAPFIGAAVFLSGLTAALPTSDYSSSGSSSGYGSSGSSSGYGSSDSSSGSSYGSSSNYGSSDSSSGSSYGGSSDSSSYGSSGSSYGSSGSNYGSGSSNNYDTSSSMDMNMDSTMMMDSTSTMMMDSSSTMMMMDSSTMNMDMTSTTTASNSYQTSNYGSGSSYWGGSGYEDCVNQCVAQFGGSSGGGSYQATATSGTGGSYGSGGVTHTVLVAPTKGVFRMMPFATNASVGDTIEFHWGADEHTVTKSSALTPCNKSSEAPVFASGEQNTSFVFSQVVNDTSPTFYYCGTPTHCEKGMFGIVNPTMASPGSPTSLGGMMSSMAANDSDLSAYSAYTSNATASNNQAATWGTNIDMSGLPTWAHALAATNVMYTRGALAMNPEILKADNSIDLSSVATTPLMLPKDLSAALDAAAAAPASTSASASTDATPAGDAATAAASSPAPSTKSNGASSVASPRFLVGAVVVLATIFAL
jgi:hypothetical protein